MRLNLIGEKSLIVPVPAAIVLGLFPSPRSPALSLAEVQRRTGLPTALARVALASLATPLDHSNPASASTSLLISLLMHSNVFICECRDVLMLMRYCFCVFLVLLCTPTLREASCQLGGVPVPTLDCCFGPNAAFSAAEPVLTVTFARAVLALALHDCDRDALTNSNAGSLRHGHHQANTDADVELKKPARSFAPAPSKPVVTKSPHGAGIARKTVIDAAVVRILKRVKRIDFGSLGSAVVAAIPWIPGVPSVSESDDGELAADVPAAAGASLTVTKAELLRSVEWLQGEEYLTIQKQDVTSSGGGSGSKYDIVVTYDG